MSLTISVAGVDRTGTGVAGAPGLLYASITLKLNTIDFALLDPAAIPALGDAIVTTDPAWSGTVAAVTTSDVVDLRNSHVIATVTATNANALPNDTAPFDLSDVPGDSTSEWELEDGSGPWLLESGTDFAPGSWLTEAALAYGYSGLSVRSMAGSPPTTLGRCTVQQPGLRPGNTVHVTSLNQGLSAVAYQVNQASVTWPQGVSPPLPVYLIEFGDTPQTLAAWTLAHAVVVVPPVVPPVFVPPAIYVIGKATASVGLKTMGGGIVTVATATFSVSSPPGHTLTIQVQGAIDAIAYGWDNYVATPRRAVRATLSGGIYTGAWQEYAYGWSGGSTAGYRATFDLSSAAGIALASGTYTVTIDINTVEDNQLQIYSGWVQVAVTTV